MRPYRAPRRSPLLRPGGRPGGHASCEWEREEDGKTAVYQISASVSNYDPGVCSGPVERCYPPEGGEVEIDEVLRIDEDGNEVDVENYDAVFTCEELSEIESELAGNVEEPDFDPDPEDYDRMRRW